MEHYKRVRK